MLALRAPLDMPSYLPNLPLIVVTGEADRAGNTAIAHFGARSCPDSESFDLSTSHDSRQVGGPFLSDSSDFTFQLDDFSLSNDNFSNGAAFQPAFRQPFLPDNSPASVFSDFDDSSSSNYDYSATPCTSPSVHSNELGAASPHLNDRLVQISLCDPASPISQSYADGGGYLRPRRNSDVPRGGRPQVSTEAGHGRSISYSGSHRPGFDCSNESRIIDWMPNVASDNGLGLTFDPIYQGSAIASGVGPSDGQGVRSQPIVTAGGEAPYTSDAGRLHFPEQRQPSYPHTIPKPTMSGAHHSHVHFRSPRPSRSIQELPFGDQVSLRDSLKLQLPIHTGGGLYGGPYSAPASYTEDRAHFPATRRTSAPGELQLSTDTASWKPDNPESHCLSPLGMDASIGFSDGACCAPASYTRERTFSAELLMRQQSTPRELRLSTDTTSWKTDNPEPYCLSPQGMDASSVFSGPYSAPASCTEERAHSHAGFLTRKTSDPSHFRGFFEDDTRDPMYDIVDAGASSAISDWSGETPGFASFSKKTVSTAKLRKASAKRRKKPGRFGCPTCGSTFTEKHNLANHYNSHIGFKPYACDRCSRGFGVASSLHRHRKTCKEPKST